MLPQPGSDLHSSAYISLARCRPVWGLRVQQGDLLGLVILSTCALEIDQLTGLHMHRRRMMAAPSQASDLDRDATHFAKAWDNLRVRAFIHTRYMLFRRNGAVSPPKVAQGGDRPCGYRNVDWRADASGSKKGQCIREDLMIVDGANA